MECVAYVANGAASSRRKETENGVDTGTQRRAAAAAKSAEADSGNGNPNPDDTPTERGRSMVR
jgi:hypothetical protein